VTAEQADWSPDGADNSIWETLTHVSYYNNAYLQRFKGIEFEYEISTNDESFKRSAFPSEDEWKKVIDDFDAVMTEFRDLLSSADETKFDQLVSDENPRKWSALIADINAHNAYHAGQILLIRKLQGSWNPEKGVS
jgi:uncharacterized damage-inducible protein DinB